MLIHAFLHFLHNYTHLYSKTGYIFSDSCHISPATVTNNLLYISMFSSADLMTSDNMFTLILIVILLYYIVILQMYVYL